VLFDSIEETGDSIVQLLDSIEETGGNYETCEDDKVGEFEKCIWVPWELKSGLGYQRTLVSLSLFLDSKEKHLITVNLHGMAWQVICSQKSTY
jgi:hypothetical protein